MLKKSTIINSVSYSNSSFPSCCSASVLTGVSGTAVATKDEEKYLKAWQARASSVAHLYNREAIERLDLHIAYASIKSPPVPILTAIAILLSRDLQQQGGSKSFIAMADRVSPVRGDFVVLHYAQWLERNSKYVEFIVGTPPTNGTHGHPVSGWMYRLNKKACEEFINVHRRPVDEFGATMAQAAMDRAKPKVVYQNLGLMTNWE